MTNQTVSLPGKQEADMTHHTWFITGINSGLGRHMTEQLLAQGHRVAGTVRQQASVADLRQQHGDHLWTATLDLTDPAAIKTTVDQAFHHFGHIDVIVNNAGYGLFGAAEEFSIEQVQHQIDTNLLGSIYVTRAALPHLRTQGSGRLIQLSTYGGQATGPGAALYHASKWGIEGFMEATAQDIAPFNIGVTIVEPGGARTAFRAGSVLPASPLEAYDASPASRVRGVKSAALPPAPGDPARMAARIIESARQTPAPRRLVLGSDAYRFIHTALTERLVELEAQQAQAALTDASSDE